MKLKLKNTPEQVELIRAMGSRDLVVAAEASQAFAAFIGPVVQKVLYQAGTSGLLYTDLHYDEDDHPSIPLDLWYNQGVDYVQTWSQNIAGGLPTSEVTGMAELKVATYRLDSAVSWLKRYARRARLDIVGKAIERMAQEILIKQERNAWAVMLKALAEAQTHGLDHIIGSVQAGEFVPHDLNRLMTQIKRINSAFNKGTPEAMSSKGLTDLFVSPEIMQQVRAFAYQPINIPVANRAAGPITLPDGARENVWNAGGMSEIYGVVLHELLELGTNGTAANVPKYNTLFSTFADANTPGPVSQGSQFVVTTNELLFGVDLSRESMVRPVARNEESGGSFMVMPDDQFVARAEKMGFYGFLEEGRICLDARALVGLTV